MVASTLIFRKYAQENRKELLKLPNSKKNTGVCWNYVAFTIFEKWRTWVTNNIYQKHILILINLISH